MDRYYHVLGIQSGASKEEIKQVYHDLVKVWHPDRFLHDEALKQKAEARLKEINEAYEKLMASPSGAPTGSEGYWAAYAAQSSAERVTMHRYQAEKLKSWASLIVIVLAGVLLSLLLYTSDNSIQSTEPRKTMVAIVSS